ncbi:MAG: hypothetical protein H8E18_04815 [FCB group bacterium]|nr:hypothetical protein [FCB group bacterium]
MPPRGTGFGSTETVIASERSECGNLQILGWWMNRDRVVGLRPSREDILGFVLSVIAANAMSAAISDFLP